VFQAEFNAVTDFGLHSNKWLHDRGCVCGCGKSFVLHPLSMDYVKSLPTISGLNCFFV
jgi:hypothetical protein